MVVFFDPPNNVQLDHQQTTYLVSGTRDSSPNRNAVAMYGHLVYLVLYEY